MSNRYVVRYGVMRSLGVFTTSRGETFDRGAKVIARTERGMEAGEVLCEATDQVVEKMTDPRRGQVLRSMSADDVRDTQRLHEQSRREYTVCKERIAALGLPMDLVDVEHVFGGERIVIYYISEVRVDFRELVKLLAGEFQTRIEMRQIGVRDEAKLLADYGDCGKPLCCNTHLSEMPPVSMKMAKLQKATLDPTKISGRCGRLKCCLRYEYDTYEDLQKDLPPVGAELLTRDGRVRVLAQEILAGQLLVETDDRRRVLIQNRDVVSVVSTGGRRYGEGRIGEEGRSPESPADDDRKPSRSERPRPADPRSSDSGPVAQSSEPPSEPAPSESSSSEPAPPEPPSTEPPATE